MKVPYLKKKPEIKSCHNVQWEDNYSWIHQENILEVLRDKKKLLPEVKKYLDEENLFADYHLKDTKNLQKILFNEIKGRIKLDDESLPYKDHAYEYWTKTTTTGNYFIKFMVPVRFYPKPYVFREKIIIFLINPDFGPPAV